MAVIAIARHGGTEPAAAAVRMVSKDLRELDATRFLIECSPELIVHAAAVLPRSFQGRDAAIAARDNRVMDDVVLTAASVVGCRVVFISSTSLYGCVHIACTEDSPVRPRGPYGEEKYRSEGKVLDLPSSGVVLRVSAPYGVRQRSSTVLMKFIDQAVTGADLLFYGTGAREQDFTAVEDIGTIIVAAAGAMSGGIFNVASGDPISMRALAALVIEVVDSTTSQVRAAGVVDPEEECRAYIDIGRASRDLGWRPRVDLRTGIQRLVSMRPSWQPGARHTSTERQ